MRNKLTVIFVLLFLTNLFSVSVFSQKKTDLKKYKTRTFNQILGFNQETTDDILNKTKIEDSTSFIGFDPFHSKVKVRLIEKSKPISETHKELIKTWAKLLKINSKFVDLFENEILVKEDESEFWIPIQKSIENEFLIQIEKGQMFTIFVVYVGGKKEKMSTTYDWLFLMNGFEK